MSTLCRLRDRRGRTHCMLRRLCQWVLVGHSGLSMLSHGPKSEAHTILTNVAGSVGCATASNRVYLLLKVWHCMMLVRTPSASLFRGLDGFDSKSTRGAIGAEKYPATHPEHLGADAADELQLAPLWCKTQGTGAAPLGHVFFECCRVLGLAMFTQYCFAKGFSSLGLGKSCSWFSYYRSPEMLYEHQRTWFVCRFHHRIMCMAGRCV